MFQEVSVRWRHRGEVCLKPDSIYLNAQNLTMQSPSVQLYIAVVRAMYVDYIVKATRSYVLSMILSILLRTVLNAVMVCLPI